MSRFAPIRTPRPLPDPNVYGVHLQLGDQWMTGMIPQKRDDGSTIVFQTLAGWWDSPGSTGEAVQRTFADGGWLNRAYRQSRILTITGWLGAGSRPELRDSLDRLMAAVPLDVPQPLVVLEDGLIRHCLVRQEGDPLAPWEGGLTVDWNIQLSAADPRRFAGDGTPGSGWASATTNLPSQSGGLAIPFVIPFVISAQTVTGELDVTLGGTTPGRTVVRFDGPVAQPGIRDRDTGEFLWFDLSLEDGQWLEVDLETHTVQINGDSATGGPTVGVSRRGSKRGTWLTPKVGVNRYAFDSTTYSADATMTISTLDAWS